MPSFEVVGKNGCTMAKHGHLEDNATYRKDRNRESRILVRTGFATPDSSLWTRKRVTETLVSIILQIDNSENKVLAYYICCAEYLLTLYTEKCVCNTAGLVRLGISLTEAGLFSGRVRLASRAHTSEKSLACQWYISTTRVRLPRYLIAGHISTYVLMSIHIIACIKDRCGLKSISIFSLYVAVHVEINIHSLQYFNRFFVCSYISHLIIYIAFV